MRETVPVGKTHALYESLAIRSKSNRDGITTMVGPTSDQNWIGRFLNFGTIHIPANHWMDRAWASSKDAALDGFINAAIDALKEFKV